ncbi:MAG: glycosyltransferase family 4 protein [Chloroflexi bacterium]|nr:glycosyltransferase family 4 protein [Chloroflexota bacterium]
MNKAASILILVTQLERAGVQKVAFKLARYFYRRGHKVTLCFFYDKYNLLEEMCRDEPFRIVSLDAKMLGQSRLANGLRTIRALWRLYRLLRRERIEIVETLARYSNILGILIAWLARVPVRVSSQRTRLVGFPRWFLRLDAWIVNSRLVNNMVAVSEQTRRFCIDVEGMVPDKVIIIPNGINLKEFNSTRWSTGYLQNLRTSLKISPGAQIVITVARLHPQKGHQDLIQAALTILAACPDAIFLLVGEGEYRATIEQYIHDAGLSQHFYLLGVRRDVPQLLALSDLFVLPSLYEGMPNVVLEAMAAKLPVVATDVDGTGEVVIHRETGLLVQKSDASALGQSIISLLDNESLRCEMGQKGYERVQTHFSEQLMCQRHYDNILKFSKLGK